MQLPRLVVGIDIGVTHCSVAWSYEGRAQGYIQVLNNWSNYKRTSKYPAASSSHGDSGTKIPSLIYYSGNNFAWGFEAQHLGTPLALFNLPPGVSRNDLSGTNQNYASEDEKIFLAQCASNGKTSSDVASDFLTELWQYVNLQISSCSGSDWQEQYRPQIALAIPSFWSTDNERIMTEVVRKAGLEEYMAGFFGRSEATAMGVLERMERKKIRRGDVFIICDAGKSIADVNTFMVECQEKLTVSQFGDADGEIHSTKQVYESYIRYLVGREKYEDMKNYQRLNMLKKLENAVQLSLLDKAVQQEYRVDLWGSSGSSEKPQNTIGYTLGPLLELICAKIQAVVETQIKKARISYSQSTITVVLVGYFCSSAYLFNQIKESNKLPRINFLQADDIQDPVCRGIVYAELAKTEPIAASNLDYPKLCIDKISLQDRFIYHRRPLRILAMDGGGVRGLSTLIILKKIMSGLVEKKIIPKGTLPCQYFDMIGGTSTGGLIAILLGRLKLSIDECIGIYTDLSYQIFGKAKGLQKATMFSSTRLEEIMNKAIQQKIMGSKTTQKNIPTCPVFVVAVNKDNASGIEGLTLFRSYRTGGPDEFSKVSIVQAARATTAAPTFFKPQKITDNAGEERDFVDGGLGHNNPLLSLLEEAERSYPCAEIGCVISIGTGLQEKVGLEAGGTRQNFFRIPILGKFAAIIDAGYVAAALATSSENVHHFAETRFRKTGIYYRFNFPNDDNIRLFDCHKIKELSESTEKYLDAIYTKSMMKQCLEKLQKTDDPANFMKVRNKRRLYSKKDDVRSMVEHNTIKPKLISNIPQYPNKETKSLVEIPPESLWHDVDANKNAYKTVSLRDWGRMYPGADIFPVGHLALSFNILRGGQAPKTLEVGRHTSRLYRFPAIDVGDGLLIPGGRWKAVMTFIFQGTDGKETLVQKCMPITLSIYTLDVDEKNPEIRPDDEPLVEATVLSAPVPQDCAQWEDLEISKSFDVFDGERVIFELSWDLQLAGPAFAEKSSLLFGGIRLSAEYQSERDEWD